MLFRSNSKGTPPNHLAGDPASNCGTYDCLQPSPVSGSVLGLGTQTNPIVTPQKVSDHVVAVATGLAHSLFVKDNGTLWAMGHNQHGQLGMGNNTSLLTPTQVPGVTDVVAVAAGAGALVNNSDDLQTKADVHGFSVFLKRDGTLWAMGSNSLKELGQLDTEDRNTPTRVYTPGPYAIVSAGVHQAVAVDTSGGLWGTCVAPGVNQVCPTNPWGHWNKVSDPSLNNKVIAASEDLLFVTDQGKGYKIYARAPIDLSLPSSAAAVMGGSTMQGGSNYPRSVLPFALNKDGTLSVLAGEGIYSDVYFADAAGNRTSKLIVASLARTTRSYYGSYYVVMQAP